MSRRPPAVLRFLAKHLVRGPHAEFEEGDLEELFRLDAERTSRMRASMRLGSGSSVRGFGTPCEACGPGSEATFASPFDSSGPGPGST